MKRQTQEILSRNPLTIKYVSPAHGEFIVKIGKKFKKLFFSKHWMIKSAGGPNRNPVLCSSIYVSGILYQTLFHREAFGVEGTNKRLYAIDRNYLNITEKNFV